MGYTATTDAHVSLTRAADGTPIELDLVEGQAIPDEDIDQGAGNWLVQHELAEWDGVPLPPPGEYDPSSHSVDEVNAYLDGHPEEAEAVLALEAAGKNRKGIVEGPHAAPVGDGDQNPEG